MKKILLCLILVGCGLQESGSECSTRGDLVVFSSGTNEVQNLKLTGFGAVNTSPECKQFDSRWRCDFDRVNTGVLLVLDVQNPQQVQAKFTKRKQRFVVRCYSE